MTEYLGYQYSATTAGLSELVVEVTDSGCGFGIAHGALSIICVADRCRNLEPRRSWR